MFDPFALRRLADVVADGRDRCVFAGPCRVTACLVAVRRSLPRVCHRTGFFVAFTQGRRSAVKSGGGGIGGKRRKVAAGSASLLGSSGVEPSTFLTKNSSNGRRKRVARRTIAADPKWISRFIGKKVWGGNEGQTDGRTDGRTDGWTDGRTDGRASE